MAAPILGAGVLASMAAKGGTGASLMALLSSKPVMATGIGYLLLKLLGSGYAGKERLGLEKAGMAGQLELAKMQRESSSKAAEQTRRQTAEMWDRLLRLNIDKRAEAREERLTQMLMGNQSNKETMMMTLLQALGTAPGASLPNMPPVGPSRNSLAGLLR